METHRETHRESGREDQVRRNVVVGVDGRAATLPALERAVTLAREWGTRVGLVHVTPSLVLGGAGDEVQAAELLAAGVLDDARERVRGAAPDVRCTVEHRVGGRAAGIAAAAAPDDLVVVGRGSRHPAPWVPHGNLASGVVSRHRGPVLVVPRREDRAGPPRVVVASAATGRHEPGLAELLAWGASHEAALALVHAWWVPDPYVDLAEQRTHATDHEQQAVLRMQRTLGPLRETYPGVRVELRVRHGRPTHVLLDECRDADLLVLPRHAGSDLLPGHVGGTTRVLLREVRVPVLVMPASRTTSRHRGPKVTTSSRRNAEVS